MSVLSKEQVASIREWEADEILDGAHAEQVALCDSHEQLRAEVERLTAERDGALRASDRSLMRGDKLQRKRDAALDQVEWLTVQRDDAEKLAVRRVAEITRERNAARAEVERLRPVVEAAEFCVDYLGERKGPLFDAVAVYRAAQPKGGSDNA